VQNLLFDSSLIVHALIHPFSPPPHPKATDPALADPSLLRQLRQNREVALARLKEVVTTYAVRQEDMEEEDRARRLDRDSRDKEVRGAVFLGRFTPIINMMTCRRNSTSEQEILMRRTGFCFHPVFPVSPSLSVSSHFLSPLFRHTKQKMEKGTKW